MRHVKTWHERKHYRGDVHEIGDLEDAAKVGAGVTSACIVGSILVLLLVFACS